MNTLDDLAPALACLNLWQQFALVLVVIVVVVAVIVPIALGDMSTAADGDASSRGVPGLGGVMGTVADVFVRAEPVRHSALRRRSIVGHLGETGSLFGEFGNYLALC